MVVVIVGAVFAGVGLLMMIVAWFRHGAGGNGGRAAASDTGFWGWLKWFVGKLLPWIPNWARFPFVITMIGLALMLGALWIGNPHTNGGSTGTDTGSTQTQTATTSTTTP
jgi:hypothetical protein